MDNDSPVDRANAEALRLAAQEWRDVATSLGANFDPQIHLHTIESRWRKYVATGKPHDSIDEVQGTELAKFAADEQRRRGISLGGCDLKLLSPQGDAKDIPRKGESLIVVATITASRMLHFRVWNAEGRMIVDTDELSLSQFMPLQVRDAKIKALKYQLEGLWPPKTLDGVAKLAIINVLQGIIGNAQLPDKPPKAKSADVEIAPDDPRRFLDEFFVDAVLNEFRIAFDMPVVGIGGSEAAL